jgi:hypothetical protein
MPPRLLLALLIYCHENAIFSSRRIERATHRDLGARYVAANLYLDYNTIAAFRWANRAPLRGGLLAAGYGAPAHCYGRQEPSLFPRRHGGEGRG